MNRLIRMFPMMNADDPKGGGDSNPPTDPKPEGDDKPIPYVRFKEVNDKYKAAETTLQAFQALGSVDDLTARLARLGELETSATEWETQRGTFEQQAREAQETLNRERVRMRFESLAEKANANNIADLERFLDMARYTVGEDGTVAGLAEAIDNLKTEKPYLFATKAPDSIGGEGNPKKPDADKTKETRLRQAAEKAKSGRPEDIAAYAELKRQYSNGK